METLTKVAETLTVVVVEVGETLTVVGEVPVILTKVKEVLETLTTAAEVEEVLTKVAEVVEASRKVKGAVIILIKMVGVWEVLTKTPEVVETFPSAGVEDLTRVGEVLQEALTKERGVPISLTRVEEVWVIGLLLTMMTESGMALTKGEEVSETLT